MGEHSAVVHVEHAAVETAKIGTENDATWHTAGEIHANAGFGDKSWETCGDVGVGVASCINDGAGRLVLRISQIVDRMHILAAGERQFCAGSGILRVGRPHGTWIAHDDPILRRCQRIADALGHHGVVGAGRSGTTRCPTPLEFVVFRLAREVAAVPKRDLLVERVARLDDFQIADIKLAGDFEDLHLHRVALRLLVRISAIAEHHGYKARALAGGGDRVAVHSGVGATDHSKIILTDIRILGRIDDVGAEARGIGLEGFHPGVERLDGGIPLRFVCGTGWNELLEQVFLRGGEEIEVEVIFASDFIMENPGEHQRALGTARWVEVETFLEMRRQGLEISFALVAGSLDHGGQRSQLHGGGIQRHGFFPGGIM